MDQILSPDFFFIDRYGAPFSPPMQAMQAMQPMQQPILQHISLRKIETEHDQTSNDSPDADNTDNADNIDNADNPDNATHGLIRQEVQFPNSRECNVYSFLLHYQVLRRLESRTSTRIYLDRRHDRRYDSCVITASNQNDFESAKANLLEICSIFMSTHCEITKKLQYHNQHQTRMDYKLSDLSEKVERNSQNSIKNERDIKKIFNLLNDLRDDIDEDRTELKRKISNVYEKNLDISSDAKKMKVEQDSLRDEVDNLKKIIDHIKSDVADATNHTNNSNNTTEDGEIVENLETISNSEMSPTIPIIPTTPITTPSATTNDSLMKTIWKKLVPRW